MGRPGVQAITPESAIMMPESAITMAESAITMPGITDHDAGTGDHDGLETVIPFDWIPRSRSPGLRIPHRPVTHRLVLARIGVHLRPIHRQGSELDDAGSAGDLHDLHEQHLERDQVLLTELRDHSVCRKVARGRRPRAVVAMLGRRLFWRRMPGGGIVKLRKIRSTEPQDGWATLCRAIWHRTGGVACWTADYATSTARHSSRGRGRDGVMPIRVAVAVGPRWWTGNWSGTSSFIAHCADDSTFKATKQPRSAERLKRAVKRGTKSSMPRSH